MELLFHRHGLYFHDWFSLLLQPAPLGKASQNQYE